MPFLFGITAKEKYICSNLKLNEYEETNFQSPCGGSVGGCTSIGFLPFFLRSDQGRGRQNSHDDFQLLANGLSAHQPPLVLGVVSVVADIIYDLRLGIYDLTIYDVRLKLVLRNNSVHIWIFINSKNNINRTS